MKFATVAIIVLFGFSSFGKENPSTDPNGPRFTQEQLERIRAANKVKADRTSGGRIIKPGTMQGRILFVNCQNRISILKVKNVAAELAKNLKMNIGIENAVATSWKSASDTLRKSGANIAVIIAEYGEDIPLMLVSPEDRWALVNISKLGNENKEERLEREALRAFMYIAGGLSSQYQHNLADPITTIDQLDDYPTARLPMDLMGRFKNYLPRLGVTSATVTSYKKACEEGWAPAPTNDVQKAIWDKVHQLPTKPIKILPETNPVKE